MMVSLELLRTSNLFYLLIWCYHHHLLLAPVQLLIECLVNTQLHQLPLRRLQVSGVGLQTVPGLNFINVLCTAFTLVAPKSVRIQSNPQYLFTLLGSTCAKAVRRTLVKLTPDFFYIFRFSQFANFSLVNVQSYPADCVTDLD